MKNQPIVSTILYATDLGEQTRPVFRHALGLAKLHNAKIIMMHVVEPLGDTTKQVLSMFISREVTDEMQKETMTNLLETMKKRLRKFFEDECDDEKICASVKQILLVSGRPSEEILRIAEEEKADMIIVGKSTKKIQGDRVMGSTARRITRMANVPVLVVPNYIEK